MDNTKVYVLVFDGDAWGVYSTYESALNVGVKAFGDKNFMVSECDSFLVSWPLNEVKLCS
jgi:hypothetical protein